jgi:hypothetical protein
LSSAPPSGVQYRPIDWNVQTARGVADCGVPLVGLIKSRGGLAAGPVAGPLVGLLVSCAQTAKVAASRQPTETANAIVLRVTVILLNRHFPDNFSPTTTSGDVHYSYAPWCFGKHIPCIPVLR